VPRQDPENAKADVQRWRENNREKYNAYMRNYRSKAPQGDDPDHQKEVNPHDPRNPAPHGTVQRYRRHKCRCPQCKAAQREAQAEYRARKKDT
jgi:hypothetical protein